MTYDEPMVLVFDADCSLCRSFASTLERAAPDGALRCRPLGDDGLYEEYPQLSRDACARELHLVDERGVVHVGAGIVEPLAARVPLVRSLAWMVELPGGEVVAEAVVELAGELRKRLGGLG